MKHKTKLFTIARDCGTHNIDFHDYHGAWVEWKHNQSVTHITDDGEEFHGRLKAVKDGLLLIEFPNKEEGWERPETCYQ